MLSQCQYPINRTFTIDCFFALISWHITLPILILSWIVSLQTWDYEDSWLYCIDFLGEDPHEFDTRFRYRVRWSIPTRRKPIPRATACVYFSFVVSSIKPGVNFLVISYYPFIFIEWLYMVYYSNRNLGT